MTHELTFPEIQQHTAASNPGGSSYNNKKVMWEEMLVLLLETVTTYLQYFVSALKGKLLIRWCSVLWSWEWVKYEETKQKEDERNCKVFDKSAWGVTEVPENCSLWGNAEGVRIAQSRKTCLKGWR